jgi:hypothetical protein
MNYFLIYVGIGIASYFVLLFLVRKTGVDRKGLHNLWGWSLVGDWGFILVPLLWPLLVLLSLLWWLGDYWHLKSKRSDATMRTEKQKRADKYSHLTMDELLAAQKRNVDELQNQK